MRCYDCPQSTASTATAPRVTCCEENPIYVGIDLARPEPELLKFSIAFPAPKLRENRASRRAAAADARRQR